MSSLWNLRICHAILKTYALDVGKITVSWDWEENVQAADISNTTV